MSDVESTVYSDDGAVNAEAVITTEDTEFVVVDSDGSDHLRVYEREPGQERPLRRRV